MDLLKDLTSNKGLKQETYGGARDQRSRSKQTCQWVPHVSEKDRQRGQESVSALVKRDQVAGGKKCE